MKKADAKNLAYLLNIALVLLTGYCLVKYTMTMENHPTCKTVENEQRNFLYWAGVFILANVIVSIVFKFL